MVVLFLIFKGILHTVFHSGHTSLHFHQWCKMFPFPLAFLMRAIKQYLTVVLIHISLMISDAQHLLMYLLAICMSSLKKISIQFLCPFLIGFFTSELYEFFI